MAHGPAELLGATSSPVTVFTTSGPVMNMWLVSCTMKMKSVMRRRVDRTAGARAEDDAYLGTTPDAFTLRKKMPP